MKKFLNLRNILICGGALLALVGFFVALAAGLKGDINIAGLFEAKDVELQGIVMGAVKARVAGGEWTAGEADNPLTCQAGLPLAGVIMMLVAGLGACGVGLFVKKPWAKWIVLGLAVVVLTGAIFSFIVKDGYINSVVDKAVKDGTVPAQSKEMFKGLIKDGFAGLKLNAGAVFTGILGILGALGIGASQFVKEN